MRTIKTAANADDRDELSNRIHEAMINCGEICGLSSIVDIVAKVEEENGIRFSDREIVKAWSQAASATVDSFIYNASDTLRKKEMTQDEYEAECERLAAMEPTQARINSLMKKFKGE